MSEPCFSATVTSTVSLTRRSLPKRRTKTKGSERMNEAAPRVIDLLTYIEQVEKLKTKPTFLVPTEYFVAYQHELRGLPELQFNLQAEGDDVWLRVPRLQE